MGALREVSGADRRAFISSTSARDTPIASAISEITAGAVAVLPSRESLARRRRRLKNSAFWVDEVPPRTIDQLRRM